MHPKIVLFTYDFGVRVGVVIETIMRLKKGGGEEEVFSIAFEYRGTETIVQAKEEDCCVILHYNTSDCADYAKKAGGLRWAKEKAKEFEEPKIDRVPAAPVAVEPPSPDAAPREEDVPL